MRVSHPECDVRPWLVAQGEAVAPYTATRIRTSYEAIPSLLSACPDLRGRAACDVGCGSGFDTFALGMFFDRVVGVDSNAQAVAEAERIAREAGISNVRFECARAERYALAERFEFVFCNLMSHNLPSRLALMRRMADLLQPGGVLLYTEIAEGYPPLEAHRALRRRDAVELALRCRQIVNGFARRKGFRFFLGGTGGTALQAYGFRLVHREVQRWNGLPILDRQVGVRDADPAAARFPDPDYPELDGQFAEAADAFRRAVRGKCGHFSRVERQDLFEIATGRQNPFMPFLLYLLMADTLFPVLGLRGPLGERLCRRLLGEPGPQGDAGWGELERLDRTFLETVRRRAGLDGPWDD